MSHRLSSDRTFISLSQKIWIYNLFALSAVYCENKVATIALLHLTKHRKLLLKSTIFPFVTAPIVVTFRMFFWRDLGLWIPQMNYDYNCRTTAVLSPHRPKYEYTSPGTSTSGMTTSGISGVTMWSLSVEMLLLLAKRHFLDFLTIEKKLRATDMFTNTHQLHEPHQNCKQTETRASSGWESRNFYIKTGFARTGPDLTS